MTIWRDPRVLHDDWCPPSLEGRDELLGELRSVLPTPVHPNPRTVAVLYGPRGAGSSTVARWFVRALLDLWTASSPRFPPLFLRVDVARARSPSQIVVELFRQLDPTMSSRGASTEQLLLLLLRRLRTLHRPTIVWLDQLRPARNQVARVLLPLIEPDRFLPEGTENLPLLAVVASGSFDPLDGQVDRPEERPFGPVLLRKVAPLPPEGMLRVLETRARLAFESPPAPAVLRAVRDLLLAHGWGLSTAAGVLEESGRRALARGGRRVELEDVRPPPEPLLTVRESHLFDALILETMRSWGPLAYAGGVPLHAVRRRLRDRCAEEGQPHPAPARLWRHVVELERSGVLARSVRVGGPGGTQSRLRLLQPGAPPGLPAPLPPLAPGRGPAPEEHPGPSGPASPRAPDPRERGARGITPGGPMRALSRARPPLPRTSPLRAELPGEPLHGPGTGPERG